MDENGSSHGRLNHTALVKMMFPRQNIVFPLLKRAFMSVDIRNMGPRRAEGGRGGGGLGVCQSLMYITKEDENIFFGKKINK